MKEGKALHNRKPSLPNFHIGQKLKSIAGKLYSVYDKAIDVLATKTARSLDRTRLSV